MIVCCAVCPAWGVGEDGQTGKWFCFRCVCLLKAQLAVARRLGYHPN